MDWDTALRENNGRVNPLGLFDLDRNIRPVGESYRQLIADWSEVLPTESLCLTVPLDMPERSASSREPAGTRKEAPVSKDGTSGGNRQRESNREEETT